MDPRFELFIQEKKYLRIVSLATVQSHPKLMTAHFASAFRFLRASGLRDLSIRVLAP
jgi:hypothetical protein